MKEFKFAVSNNPVFNTVTDLSNTTFDPSNVVNNRGASEGQVKYVYDLIKALQDWLDEHGCSSDPYAIIRQKVDELEEAIGICCANPQDTLIQTLTDRLNALEQSIEDCCNQSEVISTCDGNTITVSFSWNSTDPVTDGGQTIAVSTDTSRNISAYYFLLYDVENGLYRRITTAFGGDVHWSIDKNTGAVSALPTPISPKYNVIGIVAVDTQGCEGMTSVNLPVVSLGNQP